jgi:menaquinone-dependent protoporphyrinogen oxidase
MTVSRALVVYGSKRGGTAGLAQMVGSELQAHGWEVVVQDASRPADLRGVDLVLIGGALYMNRWHKAARSFARRREPALRTIPVWLFSSGPLDDSATPGDIAPVPQVQAIARRLEARGHMTFGGRLAADATGLAARSLAKKCAGDYRDPAQIAGWVQQISHELTPVDVVLPAQRGARNLPNRPLTGGRRRGE